MVHATVLPCAAILVRDYWQPCAEMMKHSQSKMRRMRDRRVAIRHSQKQTLMLRQCLKDEKPMHVLNAGALEFVPGESTTSEDGGYYQSTFCDGPVEEKGVVIDMDSLVFSLERGEVVMHSHPEKCGAVRTPTSPIRRELREPLRADQLADLPALPRNCLVNACFGPERRATVETQTAEVLPLVGTPIVGDCLVVVDKAAARGAGESSPEPCRGPGHAACDKCYVPDGRYGRNKRCTRKCAVIKDGSWGPTKCCDRCEAVLCLDTG